MQGQLANLSAYLSTVKPETPHTDMQHRLSP